MPALPSCAAMPCSCLVRVSSLPVLYAMCGALASTEGAPRMITTKSVPTIVAQQVCRWSRPRRQPTYGPDSRGLPVSRRLFVHSRPSTSTPEPLARSSRADHPQLGRFVTSRQVRMTCRLVYTGVPADTARTRVPRLPSQGHGGVVASSIPPRHAWGTSRYLRWFEPSSSRGSAGARKMPCD